MKKIRETSIEAFHRYFTEVYGARWPVLLEALVQTPRRAVMQNPFGDGLQDYTLDEASLLPAKHLAAREGQKIADFCASPGGKSLATMFAVMGNADFFCSDLSPARITRLRAVFQDCLPEAVLRRIQVMRGGRQPVGNELSQQF